MMRMEITGVGAEVAVIEMDARMRIMNQVIQ